MSAALYHKRVMALAKSGAGAGEVSGGLRAKLFNPMCGDEVEVSARVEDGVVSEVAHRVRGCVLCRASASAMAEQVRGATVADATARAEGFGRMLCEGGEVVEGLEMFSPVASRPSRRQCALLPFRALEEILKGG